MKLLHKSGKQRRAERVRAKIKGTVERPRLSVFRSGKHINAQLIDDINGKTLLSVSDLSLKKEDSKGNKADKALRVGQEIALRAKDLGVKTVVFDRGSFRYHGRVKAVAEGAREKGLVF